VQIHDRPATKKGTHTFPTALRLNTLLVSRFGKSQGFCYPIMKLKYSAPVLLFAAVILVVVRHAHRVLIMVARLAAA
jgi:hypothetical protein